LVEAQLKLGEQELLESDFEKLNNVEIIKEAIDKSLLLPMKIKLVYCII
jgi:DNA repair protein RecN (Recombination protein N)